VTKFAQGAWLVIVAIPLLVVAFYGVHRHYRRIGRRLRAGIDAMRAVTAKTTNTTVLYVESLDEATDEAVWYARLVAGGETRAIHVPGPHTDSGIRARWFSRMGERPRLEILAPEGSRADAAMEYVWTLPRGEADFVTVVIPELFRRRSLTDALRRRVPVSLKLRLLYESGVAITDVPVVAGAEEGLPKRVAARIFVSGVHAATLRALNYARTLGLPDTRAVYFAFSTEDAERMRRDWLDAGLQTPLEVVEAQFRDIGTPLLAYLRALTVDPDVAVAAVMPEIVVRGWSRLLHNQRALYLKRLLLFEPRVILTSVPYQLFR
jgi:hypothetical protein